MNSVSIITVVKDNADGLVATYSSLREQSFREWEMIIIAGKSKDSTLSTAKKLQEQDRRINVFEERGKSIYGAMNEGLEVAHGEYVWFMNAGDRFAEPSVLAQAVAEISTSNVGVVIGGYGVNGFPEAKTYQYPRKNLSPISFAFNRRGGCHQAMIFRTDTLKGVGCYDPSYSLASDFGATLKVIKKAGACRVHEIYAFVEPGGLADQGILTVHQEKHRIRGVVFRSPIINFVSLLWTWAAQSKINIRTRAYNRIRKGV